MSTLPSVSDTGAAGAGGEVWCWYYQWATQVVEQKRERKKWERETGVGGGLEGKVARQLLREKEKVRKKGKARNLAL